MPIRLAITTLLILAAVVVYAAPNEKETVQVVSSRTKLHGHPPDEVFEYTDVMFTLVGEKRVAYGCDQRGNVCPTMESRKMYTAYRDGKVIYISMNSPTGKPLLVKYKELGGW